MAWHTPYIGVDSKHATTTTTTTTKKKKNQRDIHTHNLPTPSQNLPKTLHMYTPPQKNSVSAAF